MTEKQIEKIRKAIGKIESVVLPDAWSALDAPGANLSAARKFSANTRKAAAKIIALCDALDAALAQAK